jgi:hypothetical protein
MRIAPIFKPFKKGFSPKRIGKTYDCREHYVQTVRVVKQEDTDSKTVSIVPTARAAAVCETAAIELLLFRSPFTSLNNVTSAHR